MFKQDGPRDYKLPMQDWEKNRGNNGCNRDFECCGINGKLLYHADLDGIGCGTCYKSR
jgi:hypothetical protein